MVLCILKKKEKNGQHIVIDNSTGLTWQQSGSQDSMIFEEARTYIQKLNKDKYAGFDGWRLPTLEEAMSLMVPQKQNNGLYIEPIFDKTQRWIWTSDKQSASDAWVVYFDYGYCIYHQLSSTTSVRAVR